MAGMRTMYPKANKQNQLTGQSKAWRYISGISFYCFVGLLGVLGGCGGGGSSTDSNPFPSSQLAVGSNSIDQYSGLYVNNISSCSVQSGLQPNVIQVCVDDGPYTSSGRQIGAGNRPFVTVRVCVPGSTTACVDVDHMLVDTGSTGVRIAVPALRTALPLPAIKHNGNPIAECMHFISGWAWGSLNEADIYVGGLVARKVPIQMMGNSSLNPRLGGNGAGAFPRVPTACSQAFGTNVTEVGTVDAMRANGIIGLGVWLDDALNVADQFFTCTGNVCNSISTLPRSSYPRHIGRDFPSFSGGVALQMRAIGSNGSRNLPGTLTFGIATLPSTVNRLALDPSGYFTTRLSGVTYTKSFIDSGSSGIFFDTRSSSLPKCTSYPDFYCPTITTPIFASSTDFLDRTGSINFSVGNAEESINNPLVPNALNNLAGPVSTLSSSATSDFFLLGFPFFVGRTVYTVMQDTSIGGSYGLIAFTP